MFIGLDVSPSTRGCIDKKMKKKKTPKLKFEVWKLQI
jgi:hypothetical protein